MRRSVSINAQAVGQPPKVDLSLLAPQFPLTNKLWRGMFPRQRCFIIGGGPSLVGFDWSLLKDEITIGINKAFAFFDPTIIFSMDRRFWVWIEEAKGDNGFTPELRDRFIDYRHGYKVWLNPYNSLYTPDIIQVRCGSLKGWGESLESGLGHGNNSGFAALNLAYALGFSEIFLLGIDMKGADSKQKWFHDGYPIVTSDEVYPSMIEYFNNVAAPACSSAGVKVWNCSESSALTCFEHKPLAEVEFNKNPLVLCFHTPDKLYSDRAAILENSLKQRGYRRKFRVYDRVGNWMDNVKVRQRLLLEEMEKEEEEEFILLDADAVVVGDLMQIRDDWSDIACHLRLGEELLMGTLYIKNNPRTRELVREWIKLNEAMPEIWEQRILHQLVKVYKDRIKFRDLPAEFCTIFDIMSYVANPIVLHTQASREVNKNERI